MILVLAHFKDLILSEDTIVFLKLTEQRYLNVAGLMNCYCQTEETIVYGLETSFLSSHELIANVLDRNEHPDN